MRKSIVLLTACVFSLLASEASLAQPRPYREAWPGRDGPRYAPGAGEYYYNGRWVGPDEWRRYEPQRERWARDYRRRYPDRRHDDDSSALAAGIIGFALGAAIVGSMQDAERARTADTDWDRHCARKYRSYDPRSRTYLGTDGFRHYCR